MCTFKNYKDFISDTVPEVFNIPEYINQKPVEEIGPRAFYGCRGLRRIVVPKTVRRISSYAFAECRELESFVFPWRLNTVDDYAFYNCMGLHKITFGPEVASIGYGAFKNCLELHEISVSIKDGQNNCLNAILQDEFQEVDVAIDYLDKDEQIHDQARLVFTDYQYEYVPEIEARQFNWETYGSGDSYRISIRDTDIDYDKYDSVFSLAMVEDDMETLLKICAGRLCWPYRLSDQGRDRYENYIKGHMSKVLERLIKDRGTAALSRLFDYILNHHLMDDDSRRLALDLCQRFGQPQLTARLMDDFRPAENKGLEAVQNHTVRSRFAL